MPNHERIDRHAFVAVGSGYWRHHRWDYKPVALYFWWVLGSINLGLWGYMRTGGGWTGEALPRNVFATWRRWAHRRDYLRRDLETNFGPHRYDEVAAPIRAWLFADDPIANERSAPGILDNYPNAPKTLTMVAPGDVGVRRIGHEGAFRAGREALWDRWWRWLADGEEA